MQHNVIMGVDPSMRSTGIVVKNGPTYIYHLICSHTTKKVQRFTHDRFHLHLYEPEPVKDKTAIEKETAKTNNVAAVIKEFCVLLDKYKPSSVRIEAIAMAASGKIDELAGLNYAMRLECIKRNIPVYAITPTSNKMEFVGNGQATKEMMVGAWRVCDECADIYIDQLSKHVEDLADAYALCHYPT